MKNLFSLPIASTVNHRYPYPLQLLHWAIASLVATQFALILVLRQLQSLTFGQVVIAFHQQVGSLLLILIVVRLILAMRLRAPGSNLPRWQVLAARCVHLVILAALVAQPVLGLLVSWSRGDSITFLGLVTVPRLIELSTSQGVTLEVWHRWLAYGLLVLILVHIGAVAFNRIFRRISVLDRMLAAPPVDGRGVAASLHRLSFGLILMLAMVVGVWAYALQQYEALGSLRARFDDIEATLLDDMRTAQLDVVNAERARPMPGDRKQAVAQSLEIAETVDGFAARLSTPDARTATRAAAAALKSEHQGPETAAADRASIELQDAIDAQSMVIFDGRMKVAEATAAGRDLLMLSLAPTILLSMVLAFMMGRSLISVSTMHYPPRRRASDRVAVVPANEALNASATP